MLRAVDLKQKALEAGFDLAGIASIDDPALGQATSRYREWLDAGRAASMEYLERHAPLKAAPESLLPNAQSILCVGLLYGADQPRDDDGARALISIYARGSDYHGVMSERLEGLRGWLQSEGVSARPFVDAQPVFERFWAWRAGLGWIGRNSVLINRKLGSFVFLGGLLVAAPLDPDAPATDHCGRCRKCIDACPTQALLDDRSLDAAKCIAFHTIENRGFVPEPVMKGTGRWVAGCDICQDVCPWNDPATPGLIFQPTNPAFGADLRELASWSADEFKSRMKGVAMARMKFSMFVRNVAIAIGNSELQEAERTDALDHLERAVLGLDVGLARDAALSAVAWARGVRNEDV